MNIYLRTMAAAFFVISMVLFLPETSRATDLPIRVEDPKGAIKTFQPKISYMADTWEEDLGIDMRIVVIQSGQKDILIEARDIFNQKGVGEKSSTGGILIAINTVSGEARLVVSHNLEGAFTDAVVGSIVKSQLAPYASYNMLGMAIMDTLRFMKDHALVCSLNGSLEMAAVYKNKPGNKSILGFYSGGGGGQVKFPAIDFNSNWKKPPEEKNKNRYLPGKEPLQTVESYVNAMNDMTGYPRLEIYTEATKVLRESYPFAPYETYKKLLMIERSRPLSVQVDGQYAVVSSGKPAHGFMPILLKNKNGFWLIDEPEMYKNLFFDKDGNFFVHNNMNQYMFGLSRWGKGNRYDVTPLDDAGELEAKIASLRRQDTAASNFMLAELLFRNAFAAMEALDFYERAVSMTPDNIAYRNTLAKRYIYLGMADMAIPHLEKTGDSGLIDLAWAYKDAGRCSDALKQVTSYQKLHPDKKAYTNGLMEWVKGCESPTQ
jgi:tetratricopeptide (TPR) repeat protein